MCLCCTIGADRAPQPEDGKLSQIFRHVKGNPLSLLRLCCNVNPNTVYAYQNPGTDEDTPEGSEFNVLRDLNILQKLGLFPGDARPGISLFYKLKKAVPSTRDVCGYEGVTSETWKGCAEAQSGHYEKGLDKVMGILFPRVRSAEALELAKRESVREIEQANELQIRPGHIVSMAYFYADRIGTDRWAPIEEDNLYEVIERIQKKPDIPVTIVGAHCMVCPPCSCYDPGTGLCLHRGVNPALRAQRRALLILQRLGLKYGDHLPARELVRLMFERLQCLEGIKYCADGIIRGDWKMHTNADGDALMRKAREAGLGIPGLAKNGHRV